MKKIDFGKMEIINNFANKTDDSQGEDNVNNCYDCDSEGCDGGPCDCDDGGYQD